MDQSKFSPASWRPSINEEVVVAIKNETRNREVPTKIESQEHLVQLENNPDVLRIMKLETDEAIYFPSEKDRTGFY